MIKTLSKHNVIQLNVLSLPVLLLLLVASLLWVAIGTKRLSPNFQKANLGLVLSDNDENEDEKDEDEEDEEDDEDEDRDEDENESEDRDDEDEEDEEDDEDDEKSTVELRTSTKSQVRTSSQDNDLEDEDEDESEDENEVEDEDENEDDEDDDKGDDNRATVTTVQNPDGTTTRTIQKVEDNGKFETKVLVFDKDGKLIKETEIKSEKGKTELESQGENKGEKFKIIYKASTKNSGTDTKLKAEVEMKLKQEVETNAKLGQEFNEVELKVKTENGTFKYEGDAYKDEKFLGLFGVNVPTDIEVDSNTGVITKVNQGFWSKVLDFFSF